MHILAKENKERHRPKVANLDVYRAQVRNEPGQLLPRTTKWHMGNFRLCALLLQVCF
jgi:hypothetical protein